MRIKTVLYKSLNVFVVLAMMLAMVPMGGVMAQDTTGPVGETINAAENRAALDVTDVDLWQSTDVLTWIEVPGSYAHGFVMVLDGSPDTMYYLDTNDVQSTTALADGEYPFYLDTTALPTSFYDDWALRGVTTSADPDSWQEHMYLIITGTEPMFYLKVDSGAVSDDQYTLLDGLYKDHFLTEAPLQINGDYTLGAYTFYHPVDGVLEAEPDIVVNITFTDVAYTITASAGTGGSIDPSGAVPVAAGADQSFMITADSGYRIEDVLVDNVTQGAVASYTFTDVTDNHTIEASYKQVFTITGTVTVGEDGPPLEGVTLTYGDGVDDDEVTTNAEGNYEIIVDSGWSGTVTPSLAGYRFEPELQEYKEIISDQTQDYTAIALVSITGRVIVGGDYLPDVILTYSDGVNTGETKTNPQGRYTIIVDSGWSGMVKPSLAGYRFEPIEYDFTENPVEADLTAQNFDWFAIVSITGTVTEGTDGLEGVTLSYGPAAEDEVKTNDVGEYEIIVDSGWSGTVTPSKDGYRFDPTSQTYDNITVNQTQDYTPIKTYTLTVAVSPVGVGTTTPAVGTYTYDSGTSVDITATAASGYRFVNWSGGVEDPNAASTSVIMNADKTVTAEFELIPPGQYTLTVEVTPEGGGTVGLNPEGGTYDSGIPVTLTAVAEDGYTFSHWSGDLSGIVNPETIVMDGEKTVTAIFTINTYTVTFNANGGTGMMNPQSGEYNTTEALKPNAFTMEGHTFSGWNTQADGLGISSYTDEAEYIFVADVTLYAQWTEVPTVTVTAEESQSKVYGENDPVFTYTYEPSDPPIEFEGELSREKGEDVGIYAITQGTLTAEGYTIDFVPADFTITKKAALVTPNAASKIYGDADPALTGTLEGFLSGDNVTAEYSRVPGETVAGSPYTISAVLSPPGVLDNYEITYNTADFTINPRPITVRADDKSKTVGQSDPELTYSITSGSLVFEDDFTGSLIREEGEDIGTYEIQQGDLALNANYNLTFNTGIFTISALPIVTVTAEESQSKVYGENDPVFTYTYEPSDPPIEFEGELSREKGEDVGIYAITQGTLTAEGYTIDFVPADFTITKKAASVTPNAASKIYGDADPALTGTLEGFLSGDNVTAEYSRVPGETVAGSPYTISAVLSPPGVLDNYEITYNTADFTITKKAASVTPNAASKIYGDADPALTGTLEGFLSGDNVTAEYSRVPGETVAGSPYTISAVLSPPGVLDNYEITYNTADFTITKKAALVTPNAASKIYGDADPALTGTLEGFLSGDNVTAEYSRVPGETVAGSPYTISAVLSPPGVLDNYEITYNTADFTINPRPITVRADDKSKTVGQSDPELTYSITSGSLVFEDDFTGSLIREEGEDIGTYEIQQGDLALNANYNLTFNTGIFTISALPIVTVTAEESQSKVYGENDPVFTYTYEPSDPPIEFEGELSREKGEDVGIYAITQGTLTAEGYTIDFVPADFTITKKAASVTPNAASKIYGDADPALTGTLEGFLSGDNVTAEYSRVPGETVAGSPYTISAVLSPPGVLDNYEITYNTADFTITKKAALVTPNAASKIYGDADPALTGTLEGFLSGDNVTAEYSRVPGETVAGSPYTISAVLSPPGVLDNYEITYNTADFTITKKAALVTPNAASKIYGDADPALTGTLEGFLSGDNVTAEYSRVPGETVAGSPYTISAVLSPPGVLDNYEITYNTADFTITKKAASVTPNAASKIYGDADPALTGTLEGFLSGDNVTAEYSRVPGETVAGSPYTISAVLSPPGVLDNYEITYNTADFTITKKAASVTPNAASKIYGDADPALTGTLEGFLSGDNVTAEYSRVPGETVAGSPYTISAVLSPPGVLDNYEITYNTADFTITKKAASVTPNAASKIYGDADPALTGTLEGFLSGDNVTAEYSRVPGETVAGSPYTISAVLSPPGVLDNYEITYNTADFTIIPRTIDIAAIPGVTPPTTGVAPVTSITPTDQYTGSVIWDPPHSTFAAGTVYTATITLTAKDGYTFEGVAENFFTVAGAKSVSNAANGYVVTAVFPQIPTAANHSYETPINTSLTVLAPGVLTGAVGGTGAVLTAKLVSNPKRGRTCA
jgi:hypothetical protein